MIDSIRSRFQNELIVCVNYKNWGFAATKGLICLKNRMDWAVRTDHGRFGAIKTNEHL